MENPEKIESMPIYAIANILLGQEKFNPDKLSLPPEIQYKVFNLLFSNIHATTLSIAAKTINTLAQVNKELYNLINNSQFCLQLIKYFAQRFDCSDETVAIALQTKEAQRRLIVQKDIETLFCNQFHNAKALNRFYKQYQHYVDLNFTYKHAKDTDFKYTLLTCNIKIFINDIDNLKWLLAKNININCVDAFGITPLMKCAIKGKPHALQLLCKQKGINLNQQNKHGETALMLLCKYSATLEFNPVNMKILINAGADPNIPNKKGESPLATAQLYGNENAINAIQNALITRNAKK